MSSLSFLLLESLKKQLATLERLPSLILLDALRTQFDDIYYYLAIYSSILPSLHYLLFIIFVWLTMYLINSLIQK